MEGEWVIVWDFRDAFPWHLAIGPAMIAICCLNFYLIYKGYFAWMSDRWGAALAWIGRIWSYPILALVLIAGLAGTYFGTVQYLEMRSALAEGDYASAEGSANIVNDSPGSPRQTLQVGGEAFSFYVNDGNATVLSRTVFSGRFADGSVVRRGMYLRISYIGDRILRVERRKQD
jgi:hypothetical protein